MVVDDRGEPVAGAEVELYSCKPWDAQNAAQSHGHDWYLAPTLYTRTTSDFEGEFLFNVGLDVAAPRIRRSLVATSFGGDDETRCRVLGVEMGTFTRMKLEPRVTIQLLASDVEGRPFLEFDLILAPHADHSLVLSDPFLVEPHIIAAPNGTASVDVYPGTYIAIGWSTASWAPCSVELDTALQGADVLQFVLERRP